MKLNSAAKTYWGILLLFSSSAFYFVDDDVIGILTVAAYFIVGTTTFSLLFTIGRNSDRNYQKDVVYLTYASLILHAFAYFRSAIINNHNLIYNEGFTSTLFSLLINVVLLRFMYNKAKGGK